MKTTKDGTRNTNRSVLCRLSESSRLVPSWCSPGITVDLLPGLATYPQLWATGQNHGATLLELPPHEASCEPRTVAPVISSACMSCAGFMHTVYGLNTRQWHTEIREQKARSVHAGEKDVRFRILGLKTSQRDLDSRKGVHKSRRHRQSQGLSHLKRLTNLIWV